MKEAFDPGQEAGTGERVAWCLYDVGNSAFSLLIITALYPLYFSNVVAADLDQGHSDALWGSSISIAMALVAVTSPFMGALADRRRWRKTLVAVYMLIGVAATAMLTSVGPGMIATGLIVLVVADFAFEGSLVFYDALLPGIATQQTVGRWSGIGWGVGYLGSMVCLWACLPLVEAKSFGATFFVVAAWWFVFSLPMLLLTKDRVPPTAQDEHVGAWTRLAATWARVRSNRHLFRFFLAYFLYNDGIATTIAFAALYASHTLGFGPVQTLELLVVVQISAALGAFTIGLVTDRVGHARTIVATLVIWCGVIVAAYRVDSQDAFWGVAMAVGFVMGATQSASRGLLASVVPPEEAGELFGLKAVAGRFSAVLGPLVFGWVSHGTGSQRLALLSVGVFFLVGLVLMLGVDERRAREGWT